MIEAQSLVKPYGRFRALDGISFRVPAGTALALWGPNGCGKSTALKCLLGLIHFEGRVHIGGADVRLRPQQVLERIGFVPQAIYFYEMTVAQTVSFYAELRGVDPGRGAALLQRVGLRGVNDRSVTALSGGMRQRLALALALLGDPPVLLLDEPTANLDATGRHELVELLQECHKAGKTIVIASHRPDEIAGLADTVLMMQAGQVVAELGVDAFMAHLQGQTWLRIQVPADRMQQAAAVLATQGFAARTSRQHLLVRVEPGRKLRPLLTLEHAGLDVLDFDVEGDYVH